MNKEYELSDKIRQELSPLFEVHEFLRKISAEDIHITLSKEDYPLASYYNVTLFLGMHLTWAEKPKGPLVTKIICPKCGKEIVIPDGHLAVICPKCKTQMIDCVDSKGDIVKKKETKTTDSGYTVTIVDDKFKPTPPPDVINLKWWQRTPKGYYRRKLRCLNGCKGGRHKFHVAILKGKPNSVAEGFICPDCGC